MVNIIRKERGGELNFGLDEKLFNSEDYHKESEKIRSNQIKDEKSKR